MNKLIVTKAGDFYEIFDKNRMETIFVSENKHQITMALHDIAKSADVAEWLAKQEPIDD